MNTPFTAPSWADLDSSCAYRDDDNGTVTVTWFGPNMSTTPALEVRLVKIDEVDADGSWNELEGEIQTAREHLALETPDVARKLAVALLRLADQWDAALAEGVA